MDTKSQPQQQSSESFQSLVKLEIRSGASEKGQILLPFNNLTLPDSFSQLSALLLQHHQIHTLTCKLHWLDEEKDDITIKNQADLDEYVRFARESALKVQSPPQYEALLSNNQQQALVPEVIPLPSYPVLFINKEEFEKEEFLVLKGNLKRVLQVVDGIIGVFNYYSQEELQTLRKSEHFNEKLFLAQVELIKSFELPVNTFLECYLAGAIVEKSKQKEKSLKHYDEHRVVKYGFSERTNEQLRLLHEHELPHNWFIGKILEGYNYLGNQAKMFLEANKDSKEETDLKALTNFKNLADNVQGQLLERELLEASHLKNLPENLLLRFFVVYNQKRPDCKDKHMAWRQRNKWWH